MVEDLSEICHREVESIQRCCECFEFWTIDPSDYFTNVCSKPHLIVYAKLDFKHWPAKVKYIILDLNTFYQRLKIILFLPDDFFYSNNIFFSNQLKSSWWQSKVKWQTLNSSAITHKPIFWHPNAFCIPFDTFPWKIQKHDGVVQWW